MGHAYQGMWFDRDHTMATIEGWLWARPIFRAPILRYALRLLIPSVLFVVDRLWFGRFRAPAPARESIGGRFKWILRGVLKRLGLRPL
jgi:hypothetical protein